MNVLDEGVWEGLAIEVDSSLPAKRVVRILDRLGELCGFPVALRMDNGAGLIALELLDWCQSKGVDPRHIQPDKSNLNAFTECYNPSFRDEVFDAHVFEDLDQVRELSTEWFKIYNEERSHDALGRQPLGV